MFIQGKEVQTFGGFYYQTNAKGEAVILGAKGWPEVLIIPEEIDGHPVTEIGNSAFDTDAVMERVGLAWDKSCLLYTSIGSVRASMQTANGWTMWLCRIISFPFRTGCSAAAAA